MTNLSPSSWLVYLRDGTILKVQIWSLLSIGWTFCSSGSVSLGERAQCCGAWLPLLTHRCLVFESVGQALGGWGQILVALLGWLVLPSWLFSAFSAADDFLWGLVWDVQAKLLSRSSVFSVCTKIWSWLLLNSPGLLPTLWGLGIPQKSHRCELRKKCRCNRGRWHD